MRTADSFQRNGSLSASELETFLKGSPYACFAAWMLTDPSEGMRDNFSRGGAKRLPFNEFDRDGSGAIQLPELRRAVAVWLAYEAEGEVGNLCLHAPCLGTLA